jgi:hypothetical protein
MHWHGATPHSAISSAVLASLDTGDVRLGAQAELKILMVPKMTQNDVQSQQASFTRVLAQRIQGLYLNLLADLEH